VDHRGARLGSGRHDRVRDERCGVRRLLRVSAHGCDVTVLTTPSRQNGEGEHLWPEFLPNGKAVLFTIVPVDASIENARIAALDPARGTQHILLDHGTDAHYRMDLMLLSLTDPSHRVQPLVHTPAAEQNAEVSPNGRWLAYQSTHRTVRGLRQAVSECRRRSVEELDRRRHPAALVKER
jgi:Tol biopolymer transport system component